MRALILFCLFLLAQGARANDRIVVTATRSETNQDDLPFSVQSVDGERWKQTGGQVENALSTVPGLSFTSSGGPGQTRSVLLRGAKAEHTLVLIDGMPVNDPLSPSRAFDFGQVPVDDIERIEVIKGPQSVLYGGDAMGGVVQIFTRNGRKARARLEGGSYGTVRAQVADMGFRAGYRESRGFSSADERDGNTEPDGYRAWNLGGKQDFPVSEHFLMRLNGQFEESQTDTDKNGGPGGDSRNTFTKNSQFLLREENVILLPREAELSLAGSYVAHNREDNTNGNDFYRAYLWKTEGVLREPHVGPHSFTGGAEYAEEAGRSSQTTGGQRLFRTGGIYLQDQLPLGPLEAVVGARQDFHSVTESATTYRIGLGGWLIGNRLRAKASLGTGFKAPSLYQTYSIYGSPSLRPEKSVGGDAGLELRGADWSTELTAFGNRFREMIDYDLVTNHFFNQRRADTYGLEWGMEGRLGALRLSNALTWLRAVDPDTRLVLLRRPRLADTVELAYARRGHWGVTLRERFVGTRVDAHPLLLTRQDMPSFWTLGLDGFYSLGEGMRLVGRGENLLNRHYQETSGFGVPALSGYAGVEADLE